MLLIELTDDGMMAEIGGRARLVLGRVLDRVLGRVLGRVFDRVLDRVLDRV